MGDSPSACTLSSNYGMGLVVYVSRDTGATAPARRNTGEIVRRSGENSLYSEDLNPAELERCSEKSPASWICPSWWQITFDLAKRYNKRVGFRIMLDNPDFPEPGMPEFLMSKVPCVKLKGEWKGNRSETRYQNEHRMPRSNHPAYQAAFRELNELLAAEFNGSPWIEFMDTMMYGFWGEGHTWPFEGNNRLSGSVVIHLELRAGGDARPGDCAGE
jgi:hypothetical protein